MKRPLVLGLLALFAFALLCSIGFHVGLALADGGSAAPQVNPAADVAPVPSAQLPDPLESPMVALSDLKLAKKAGWPILVFALLVMLTSAAAYAAHSLAGYPVIGRLAAWLAVNRRAMAVSGIGATAAAAYDALINGGTWTAALVAASLTAAGLKHPFAAKPPSSSSGGGAPEAGPNSPTPAGSSPPTSTAAARGFYNLGFEDEPTAPYASKLFLISLVVLAFAGCSPSSRAKAISTTFASTNAAEAALHAFEVKEGAELVAAAKDKASLDAELADFYKKREVAHAALTATYSAIAAAVQLNTDQSVASMAAAAADVVAALKALGVSL